MLVMMEYLGLLTLARIRLSIWCSSRVCSSVNARVWPFALRVCNRLLGRMGLSAGDSGGRAPERERRIPRGEGKRVGWYARGNNPKTAPKNHR
jgi:hypothetical protein